MRKSRRHKLQGVVIVDQTRAGTEYQLWEKKEQCRHQLKISSIHMHCKISSMQNMSKLLQHTHVHSQKRGIYFKIHSLFASFPREAVLHPPHHLKVAAWEAGSVCLAAATWISGYKGEWGQQAQQQQATARASCISTDHGSLRLSPSGLGAWAKHRESSSYLPWNLHDHLSYLNEWLIHLSCLKDHNRKHYAHL